jgi:hypothetical protein
LGRATATTSTPNNAAMERDNNCVWSWPDKKANGPCSRPTPIQLSC